jgi:hypothetical protein
MDRVTDALRDFIASVESGDFFRQHAPSFDRNQRIDRDLLNNLKDTRDVLDEITNRNIRAEVLDALLCRVVFTCYLFDRKVIGEKYLASIGIKKAAHLRDVLNLMRRSPCTKYLKACKTISTAISSMMISKLKPGKLHSNISSR